MADFHWQLHEKFAAKNPTLTLENIILLEKNNINRPLLVLEEERLRRHKYRWLTDYDIKSKTSFSLRTSTITNSSCKQKQQCCSHSLIISFFTYKKKIFFIQWKARILSVVFNQKKTSYFCSTDGFRYGYFNWRFWSWSDTFRIP